MNFNKLEAKKIISDMLLIRLTEQQIVANYGSVGEEQEMRCPVHLSIGQEALAVGSCYNLLFNDKIFSTHRCHAHYLAKGGDVNKMLLEINGKMGGCLDGRGGSMHLMDEKAGVELSVPIVSSSIPLAVGSALALKIDKNPNVVMSFFGDASVEEGVFHESMNYAALKNLPIIFVCENNLYSCFTHLNDRQPKRPLEDLGKAHNIKSYKIENQNVFEIASKFKTLIEDCRKQTEPAFVVMDTYRWLQHCGVSADDNLNYRDENELNKWLSYDPLIDAENYAIKNNLLTRLEIEDIRSDINKQLENAFLIVRNAELPTPEMAKKYVYS
jgi:pyruvate dehydrogenase E1 component alpha subunit